MKKVLISFLVVVFSTVAAFAAGTSGNYSGNLNVTVDGATLVSETRVVEVTDSGAQVVIVIKNFSISDLLPASDITVTAGIDAAGNLSFESIDTPLPVDIKSFNGKIAGGNCYIYLGLSFLTEEISVTFNGNKPQ